MSHIKRTMQYIERIEMIGMSSDKNSILDELERDGYSIKQLNPFTSRRMFPKVDITRFKLIAEKQIDVPAKLIAKAPEMLERLKLLSGIIYKQSWGVSDETRDIAVEALELIKEIEGE